MKVKVIGFKSDRSDNLVKNQYVIHVDNDSYFQSYNTIIAKISYGRITLDPNWQISRTTMKYLSKFIGLSVPQIRKMINRKEIEIQNLN